MRVFGNESFRGLSVYFGSLVHNSARGDALTIARHRSFIASRLLGGLLALCVFPIYLVVGGKPSLFGAAAFLWLLSPIAIAIFLSRTGRFGAAHLISAVNFAGLVTYCAWLTGGLASGLLPWLVAVPFEAGLATDRRIVIWAGGASAFGLVVLAVLGAAGLVPASALPLSPSVFALLGAASATAYAAGLGVMSQVVHRHSESAIRESEERYRLIAENANDMITSHDAEGRVVFASLAAQNLLGEPVQKILGDGLFERVHLADRPAYLTALSRCQASNQTIAVEFRVRRPGAGEGDRYAWVEMRCRPMPSVGGAGQERSAVVAVTRDITEHKAQEAQLLKARDEAESASRAKTQFLASMSHELRTPLNAIIGFSEMLNKELYGKLGDARYRDYSRLIHESGEHLLNVVNDILDMSKIEAGKFKIVKEPLDVAALVTSCCDVMRHMAEQKQIDLKVDVGDVPALAADKRACKQMLLNLISNAIKFTEPGGWVKVTAHIKDGSIAFAVSDNGIGIADEDLARLGKPFVQASGSYDRNYEGAGLGLSVVKGLARLHDGALEITSTLGKGTTATITLPMEAESELAEPYPAESCPHVPTASAA
ncbi:PAS domain-containing sensor histidine kinase [Methyloceanibacter sp.]|jgi:cell cycle sensor histidine kinase DivJ|uniref:PAS domain-containing sensor histidine kinase n=1 Tax=Methyloceanibacter sp. TaxID=1965321 RepID=UPI0035669059